MRRAFFIINFLGATTLMVLGAAAVGQAASPGSFLGGIMISPVAAAFAVAEWAAWHGRRVEVERVLGVACLFLCALSVFGVVTNVAEALQSSWPGDFVWVVVIGMPIASYFGICGVLRVWRRQEPGKPDAGDGR